ncbi:putative spermidine/putrescine transport system permease protein [Fulvimarina manganoxydans]|uniref:Putative spermidine/putrescine transport system permease protein n=1 Tax=Fulvimarina manganoxydans TaxID=937218 RepID=A0A1W2D856_9HYPH|nr:ABC transporter permease subunit [Fulvimarina manganoxydans]MEE2951818.1 ABC transporter permease subunit [Pseudomonadota bacterium]SMC93282.1 putative spermidine/putrescine transport system permease protein [Fulvimarina manganoxydans]
MNRPPILSWLIAFLAAAYFLVPLYATFDFSLRMVRGELTFEAYRSVLSSDVFLSALAFSTVASLTAIVLGALLVVPTAYWVRLKLPRLRPVVEFLSLMPLIIPPVVLVFGYVRMYGSSSFLPMTTTEFGINLLLVIGYVTLSLPYMFRAVDNGLSAIDIVTLSEAAESLGASRFRTIVSVIFPNVRSSLVAGAFLTFSISLSEFVITSLLNRPGFGPYMVQVGEDQAYQPAALAIMAFAFTWVCMWLMEYFATRKPGQIFAPLRKRNLLKAATR